MKCARNGGMYLENWNMRCIMVGVGYAWKSGICLDNWDMHSEKTGTKYFRSETCIEECAWKKRG